MSCPPQPGVVGNLDTLAQNHSIANQAPYAQLDAVTNPDIETNNALLNPAVVPDGDVVKDVRAGDASVRSNGAVLSKDRRRDLCPFVDR